MVSKMKRKASASDSFRKGKGNKSGYVTIDRALAKHLKDFIAWKKTTGELADAEAPLLTGSADGRPYTTRSLQLQFKEVLTNAGLPTHYSIHSCRHTFATYLLAVAACKHNRFKLQT